MQATRFEANASKTNGKHDIEDAGDQGLPKKTEKECWKANFTKCIRHEWNYWSSQSRTVEESKTKLKLSYWTNLAQLLERGNINALFLADSTAGHAVHEGSMDECIRWKDDAFRANRYLS